MDISDLLKHAVEHKASDLHLTAGRPPMVRIDGRLVASGYDVILDAAQTRELVYGVLSDSQKAEFEEQHAK